MARPEVTITLGPSGKKVVRRTWDNSEGFLSSDAPALSGTKRSRPENNSQDSLFQTSKRFQVDTISRNSGYTGYSDVFVSRNDLRLKLLQKRMSRRIEEQKKKELLENMSRSSQSSVGRERDLLRNFAPLQRAGESLQSSYSSYTSDGLRIEAPKYPRSSAGISSSRAFCEVLQSPMPFLASRTGGMVSSDVLDPLHRKGPTPVRVVAATTRTGPNPSKPLNDLLTASSSMLRNTCTDEHLTVTSLLHSLGLGKYAILFQAEEVDMAALKQMGDRDLKELGIPMGPRKKILIAMLPRAKQPAKRLPSAV